MLSFKDAKQVKCKDLQLGVTYYLPGGFDSAFGYPFTISVRLKNIKVCKKHGYDLSDKGGCIMKINLNKVLECPIIH